MQDIIADALGWAGAGALLLAYALVSMKRVEGDATSYQLLNFAGGVFLVVNTVYYGAYPAAFLDFVWAIVALLALLHARRKARLRWPSDRPAPDSEPPR